MTVELKILEKYIETHAFEAVRIVENLEIRELAELMESLPVDLVVLLLSHMDRYKAARVLEKIELKVAILLIEKFSFPLAEVLLRQIDPNLLEYLLEELPRETAVPLARILEYSKNAVGAYIDPMVFTLYNDLSVEEGREGIKNTKLQILPQIYILNRNQSLVGYIELHDIVTAEPNVPIAAITKSITKQFLAEMEISVLLENWDHDNPGNFYPVVDADNTYLGIISKQILIKVNQNNKIINRPGLQTGVALGELFQIGLAGFFTGMRGIPGLQNTK